MNVQRFLSLFSHNLCIIMPNLISSVCDCLILTCGIPSDEWNSCPECLSFTFSLHPFVQLDCITDANIYWPVWHLFVGGLEFQASTPFGRQQISNALTMRILRRLDHSWHALIIMLCISALHLNGARKNPMCPLFLSNSPL